MAPMSVRSWMAPLVVGALCACGSGGQVDEQANACDDYCALVMHNCGGTNAQYTDLSSCLNTCFNMDFTDPTARTGQNIGCRTFFAAVAEGDDMASCTKAGPGGDGECGTNCDSFCTFTIRICGDEPYADYQTCMTACAGFDPSVPYSASVVSGDSLACRLYHMTAAASDPFTHCPHLAVVSSQCQ